MCTANVLLQHHILHILITHCKINVFKWEYLSWFYEVFSSFSPQVSQEQCVDCHLMEIRAPAGGYGVCVCLSHTTVRGSHVDVTDADSHQSWRLWWRLFSLLWPLAVPRRPPVLPRWSQRFHILLLHSPQTLGTRTRSGWLWLCQIQSKRVHTTVEQLLWNPRCTI